MTGLPLTVLILCTGNSARSILGEAILTELGKGRIHSFSAGSKPKAMPHPGALRLLARKGIDSSRFRSKSWNEFTGPDAPKIDVAITVCDNAAQEACPIFMGAPIKAHWGLPDPADVDGDETDVDAAFEATWSALQDRVKALMALPWETMEPKVFADCLTVIGKMDGAA
jgi:arsenate reductase